MYVAGFEAVVVNAFHLHGMMSETIREGEWPIPVHLLVEPTLLGTGGGIRNALDFFDDEPFAVVNGDIVCRLPLERLFDQHLESGVPVSLLMHDCPSFNNVAVSEEGGILGFGSEAKRLNEERSDVRLLAFTGIHFIDPAVMRGVRRGNAAEIVPLYRELIEGGHPPRALFHPELYWREIGSLRAYHDLNQELSQLPDGYLAPLPTGIPRCLAPSVSVAHGALLEGTVVAGKGTRIMEGVELENVILWDDVLIERGSRLRNCIVTDRVRANGSHENEILIEGGSERLFLRSG